MTNRRTQLHIRIILKCPDPRSNTHQPVLFLTSILDQGSDQVEVSQSDPHGEVSLKCNQHLIANTEPFKTQPDPRSYSLGCASSYTVARIGSGISSGSGVHQVITI